MDGILEQLPVFGDVQDPSDPNSPVTQVTPMGFPTFRDKPSYKLQSLLAGKAREDSDEAQGFLFDQFKIEQQKMIENALQQYQEQTQSIQEVLRTPPPKPAKAQLSRGQQIAAAIGTIIAPNQAGEIATHLMGRAHEDADKLTEQQMNEWKASQVNAVRELKSAEDIRNFRMEMQSNLATQELQLKLNEIKERRQEKDGAEERVAHAYATGNIVEYNTAMQKLIPYMTDEEIQASDNAFNEKVKQLEGERKTQGLKDKAYIDSVNIGFAERAWRPIISGIGKSPIDLTPDDIGRLNAQRAKIAAEYGISPDQLTPVDEILQAGAKSEYELKTLNYKLAKSRLDEQVKQGKFNRKETPEAWAVYNMMKDRELADAKELKGTASWADTNDPAKRAEKLPKAIKDIQALIDKTNKDRKDGDTNSDIRMLREVAKQDNAAGQVARMVIDQWDSSFDAKIAALEEEKKKAMDALGGQPSGGGNQPKRTPLEEEAIKRGLKQDANGKWYKPKT